MNLNTDALIDAAVAMRRLGQAMEEAAATFRDVAGRWAAENRDILDTEPMEEDPDNWWMRGEDAPGFDA